MVGFEWTVEVLVISSFFRFSLFFGRWKRIPFISLFSITFFFSLNVVVYHNIDTINACSLVF